MSSAPSSASVRSVPRTRRIAGWTAAAVAASVALIGAPTASASVESPTRSGDAMMVDAVQQSKPLETGGSATEFSVKLPDGASCPGDSLHDGWRVQSFMVPDGVDPLSLTYGVMGPEGENQWPLFLTGTQPLTDSLTMANASAGQPALIPALPPLSFVAFPPDVLAPGTYRIGVACTLSRQTATYWDTPLVITAKSDDQPSKLAWRLPDVPASAVAASGDDSSLPSISIILAAVAVLAAGLFFFTRSARAPATSSKES